MAPKIITKSDTHHFQHKFTQENGGRIDDFYKMEKTALGEGSYGQVAKGVNKDTGAVRAIKAIDKNKISDVERFQGEVDIQAALDHPNIVKLYEVFQDAKRYYLVMELCTGGELFDRIVEEAEKNSSADSGASAAFSEQGAATYMQQILGAMSYLHKNHFVHRDIKPENFLLQSMDPKAEIKVIDFGLAKKFLPGAAPMKTKAGTPYYVAPQVLQGSYDEKCDIWSCGVIAYILLCGYPPFYGDNDDQILRMVKKGDFQFGDQDWKTVSSQAKDMIRKMLTHDPAKRPSAADMLEHPWIGQSAEVLQGTVSADLGRKLKTFHSTSRMKKVALTLIAQQLKDDDLKELRNCFLLMDGNKDGTLTLKEIEDGMKKAKVDFPDDMIDILRNLDTDGSGNIDYTEFIAATLTKKQYLKREVMWAAFRVFDKDGDGTITKQELATILKEEGNMSYVENMVKEVDLNGDGEISFDEFCAMLEAGTNEIVTSAVAKSVDAAVKSAK
ncbi:unnamed protein product [Polarella glacialis]|uniref:non-specific serine/threonine protein kinase n=3 Tax=Polarella glacialis TaxID=89957 RepID=A0A813E725_POLGL|nr:unnamed protein product [Polarella glacialis]|mmetsp:Transcript_38541/g.69940  ORF Transcript_38541/g.69940 Transcript_38541/m.69940 type:complete len:499 (+) Transcript_38541:25-1521(+)|eukprot:CAMPEP_0115067852 /NCGR_PEP_ID=MMETSP0227-20121206/11633_1 /TAXON_ID=89957 /ORGANISM="Polarella glacialis, Strain CCMP 1383" /LENGTH=498 /DNA_ID=CAMNT_0002453991 /DNA_START=73 /DNA_END=1569 /DNA_ORIENTATION=-